MRGRFTKFSRRAKWILYGTLLIAGPNFLAFWVTDVYLGGDALNGYVKDNHYFICAHGSCREVSRATWTYSYWHVVTAFGGILLVLIEAAVLTTTKDIIVEYDPLNGRGDR